jgi:hypothetical protein
MDLIDGPGATTPVGSPLCGIAEDEGEGDSDTTSRGRGEPSRRGQPGTNDRGGDSSSDDAQSMSAHANGNGKSNGNNNGNPDADADADADDADATTGWDSVANDIRAVMCAARPDRLWGIRSSEASECATAWLAGLPADIIARDDDVGPGDPANGQSAAAAAAAAALKRLDARECADPGSLQRDLTRAFLVAKLANEHVESAIDYEAFLAAAEAAAGKRVETLRTEVEGYDSCIGGLAAAVLPSGPFPVKVPEKHLALKALLRAGVVDETMQPREVTAVIDEGQVIRLTVNGADAGEDTVTGWIDRCPGDGTAVELVPGACINIGQLLALIVRKMR